MKKRTPLDLEDAIFDSFAKKNEFDYLELPLSRSVFILLGFFVGLLGLVIFGRVMFLNIVRGGFYEERSTANINKELVVPALRGLIVDRDNRVIANNKPSFSVYLDVAQAIKEGTLEDTIQKVSEALQADAAELLAIVEKVDLEKRNSVIIAKSVTPEQVIALRSLSLPAISVESDYARYYEDGPVLAHVLGYSGANKSGLELAYDDYLKGQDGQVVIFKDAYGKEIDRKLGNPPIPGDRVVTTLDSGLQKYFYQRLKAGLEALGRDSGVGIALNPKTGAVLALVSLPSFDNNYFATGGFAKEKRQLLTGASRPMFNRAVSGLYTPGSTIKTLVALAALKEQVVTPDYQIFSKGYIEIPNPYVPDKPSRFVDWRAHGWVDLRSALARSSNVYFYEIGGGFEGLRGLGIERLEKYWRQFFLGQKTGIDLPGEQSGFLPNPAEKEQRTGQIWRIGDTYNVSIGQGDLLLTPLQLINFIGSIANGGKIYQPYVVQSVSNEQGEVIMSRAPRLIQDYSDWTEELKEVKQGMADAVEKWYGTANSLNSLSMRVAGKTGSSQIQNNTKTNAFFVGYAPVEDPQIAVLILVENSREGSLNAVPIAGDVFQWYYDNRLNRSQL